MPDERFLDSQNETIKKNGTVSNAIAYELDDLETPVLLVAQNFITDEVYGKQDYDIKTLVKTQDSSKETLQEEWDSNFTFNNGVLNLEILEIKITDYKVFQPNDSININNYPVIAFYYDINNISYVGELNVAKAFATFFTPLQNDNALQLSILADDSFLNSLSDDVEIGKTVSGAIAFELYDMENPVVLESLNKENGKIYGTQTFDTKSITN